MKFVCSHNSNHSTLPTSFGSHEVAISEISLNNPDGTKKSNVFEPNPTPVVNPLTKASNIGTIYSDPTAELLTDNGAGSYEGHIAPSTALIHEMGHALRYSTDPLGMATDEIPFEKTVQEFNFTNPEEKRNIQDIENKYVQEINDYEKNKAPAGTQPIKQSVRVSHGATPIVNKSNGVNSCTQGKN